MNPYSDMSREDLLKALQIFAKSWLAHDGCWFLAAEEKYGMQTAIELDTMAWDRFARSEAKRLMRGFDIAEGGGLEALEKVLSLRMYSVINEQHTEWSEDRQTLRFFMDICRVQETRRRKGLDDFPCRSVGDVEFAAISKTVDSRIQVRCLHCPPEAPEGRYCGWEFSLSDEA